MGVWFIVILFILLVVSAFVAGQNSAKLTKDELLFGPIARTNTVNNFGVNGRIVMDENYRSEGLQDVFTLNDFNKSLATEDTPGIIALNGDLAGTAENPRIAPKSITIDKIAKFDGAYEIFASVTEDGAPIKIKLSSDFSFDFEKNRLILKNVVRSVNGLLPDSIGNVDIGFATIHTGSVTERDWMTTQQVGNIFVITSSTDESQIGNAFVWDGVNWVSISTDFSVLDTRFVRLAGGIMAEGATLKMPASYKSVSPEDVVVVKEIPVAATESTPGLIALNGVLTGTAVEPKLKPNTIDTNHLMDNSVIGSKIADNTIVAAHIKDGELTVDKFNFHSNYSFLVTDGDRIMSQAFIGDNLFRKDDIIDARSYGSFYCTAISSRIPIEANITRMPFIASNFIYSNSSQLKFSESTLGENYIEIQRIVTNPIRIFIQCHYLGRVETGSDIVFGLHTIETGNFGRKALYNRWDNSPVLDGIYTFDTVDKINLSVMATTATGISGNPAYFSFRGTIIITEIPMSY